MNEDKYFNAKAEEIINKMARSGQGKFGEVTIDDLRTIIRTGLKEVERDERYAIIDAIQEKGPGPHYTESLVREIMNIHPKAKGE